MWKRWKIFEEFDRLFDEFKDTDFEKLAGETQYFGYSAYVGPDGVPHVETFGNVEELGPKSPERLEIPDVDGVREPYADVIVDEKKNEVIITAEVPGIDKKDVKLSATEKEIEIRAEAKDHKYYKKVPLETSIDPEKARAKYNNGILEIKAPLKGLEASRGHNIQVR